METGRLKVEVRSHWRRTLVVCGKCSRKVDGGFGPHERLPLGKALRRHLNLAKGRKARLGIVESRCLGVCPKGAVVVIDAASPGAWRIVPAGTALGTVVETFALADVDATGPYRGAEECTT